MNISILFSLLSPLQTVLVTGITQIVTINSGNIFRTMLYFNEDSATINDLTNALLHNLVTVPIQIERYPNDIERLHSPSNLHAYFESKMHIILINQSNSSQIVHNLLHNEQHKIFDGKHLVLVVFVDRMSNDQRQKDVAEELLTELWTKFKFSQVAIARGRESEADSRLQYFDIFTRNPYERRLQLDTLTFVAGIRQPATADATTDIYRRDMTMPLNMHGAELTVKMLINYFSIYNVSTRADSSLGERFSLGGRHVNNCRLLAGRLNASLRFVVPVLHKIFWTKQELKFRKLLVNMATPVQLYDNQFLYMIGSDIKYMYSMTAFMREPYDLVGLPNPLLINADNYHGSNSMYPFMQDHLVAVVPNKFGNSPNNQLSFNSSIQPWFLFTLILALFRKFIRHINVNDSNRMSSNNYETLVVDNVGIMLGTSMGIRVHGTADRIVRTAMFFSATLLAVEITTFFYGSYYNSGDGQPLIDTVDDLIRSELNICYDEEDLYMVYQGTRLQDTFKSVRSERIVQMTMRELLTEAADRNQSCAYLVPDYLGKIFTIPSMWSDHADSKPTFRIMKETIGRRMLSFSLPEYTALENRLNILQRRLIEHGLIEAFRQYDEVINYKALGQLFGSKRSKDINSRLQQVNAIQWSDVSALFNMFLLNIPCSVAAFVGELLVDKWQKHRGRKSLPRV